VSDAIARTAGSRTAQWQDAVRVAIAVTITALALLWSQPAHGQDWHTSSFSRQAAGERDLDVKVEYGAGRLNIARADAGTLYRASVRYDADSFVPRVNYARGRVRFGIEGNQVRGRNLEEGRLDIRLTPDVPVDLDVAFGAADATIDLGGIRLRSATVKTGASRTALNISSPNEEECRRLDIEVGAARFEATGLGNLNTSRLKVQGGVGEVVLDFTGVWRRDMNAEVHVGLGALTLRVPNGLGVRIVRKGVLASFDSQGLTKRGDAYYSQDWESAEHKLSLDIQASLGTIRVEWVD
jgi:hypothetical protein